MSKLREGYVLRLGERNLLLPEKMVFMLQYAANDWSRVDIAAAFGVSVRTVEGYFDMVRKGLGKKSFAAALVELYRKKIIK